MVFTINNSDYSSYIASCGFKWQRNDLDSEDAGRTMDGVMHRNRVATKVRLDITTIPLTTSQLAPLLLALKNEFVTVVYTDPEAGTSVTKTMYSNNIPVQYLIRHKDGTERWAGFTFPLIEQ